ncbi:MAG: hypothetical protein R3F60_17115 [bacterium]
MIGEDGVEGRPIPVDARLRGHQRDGPVQGAGVQPDEAQALGQQAADGALPAPAGPSMATIIAQSP